MTEGNAAGYTEKRKEAEQMCAQNCPRLGCVILAAGNARRFGSNKLLQCAHCQEQLCRYKFPRSPRFRG